MIVPRGTKYIKNFIFILVDLFADQFHRIHYIDKNQKNDN
jgi:hypothetical protein